MLTVPSGFLYHPSKTGVTAWPDALTGASGSWARAGCASATEAISARPTPSTSRASARRIISRSEGGRGLARRLDWCEGELGARRLRKRNGGDQREADAEHEPCFRSSHHLLSEWCVDAMRSPAARRTAFPVTCKSRCLGRSRNPRARTSHRDELHQGVICRPASP